MGKEGLMIDSEFVVPVEQFEQSSSKIKQLAGRAALCLSLTASMIAGQQVLPSQESAFAADISQVTVEMPFTGQWGYNALVNPDSNGNYSDSSSSHPSVHARYYGDWGTDLYAPPGTPVKLHVTAPEGNVSFSYNRSNDTCASAGANVAGRGIVLNVLVDNKNVGSIDYEHLDNIPATTSVFTNGMTIGNVTNEKLDTGCYSARHAHIELKNSAVGTNSCWVDKGRPGTTVSESSAIGVLGSGNTSPAQKCESIPGASPIGGGVRPKGRLALINSVNAGYAKDEITEGGWNRVAGNGDAHHISVSDTHLAIINGSGEAWGGDIDPAKLKAGSPGLVPLYVPRDPNYPGGVKKIETDKDGNMIAITNCSSAWGWRNVTGGRRWVPMTNCGDAIDVDVGSGQFGLINSCGGAYISNVEYAWSTALNCGDAKDIEISESAKTAVINSSNTAYVYDAPNGRWVNKTPVGDARKIAIGRDRLMVITSSGAAWAADLGPDVNKSMTQLTANGDAKAIAVGADDRMGFISSGGAAFASDTITPGGKWTRQSANGDAKKFVVG